MTKLPPKKRKVVKKWAIVCGETLLDVPMFRDEQVKKLKYWKDQDSSRFKVKLVPCEIHYTL